MASRLAVVAVVLALLAAAAYYAFRVYREPPPAPPASTPQSAPAARSGPQFPIGSDVKTLPKLGESDPALREAVTGLVDAQSLAKFFNLEDGIRRIVATVDNLSRETIARRVNVMRPIGGMFLVTGKGENVTLDPRNSARYAPFVRMVEAIDTPKAVRAYVSLYPLFQQAFVELGYPDGYFNDRLVEVIDDLLETPEPQGPVNLVSPHVLFEYADPELERLSSGQKMLIRVGPENEARLKAKLKQVRAEVVAASTPR